MEVNKIVDNLKIFLTNEVNLLAKDAPLISFCKPIINRAINNNCHTIHHYLSMIADKDNNIDIENLINEMTDSLVNSQTFEIHNKWSDITVKEGKIILNVPFLGKDFIFSKEDIDKLRTTLIVQ